MKERFIRIRSFDSPEIHKIKEKTYKLLFYSYVFKSIWSKYAATMYSLEFGATYWLLHCMGKRMWNAWKTCSQNFKIISLIFFLSGYESINDRILFLPEFKHSLKTKHHFFQKKKIILENNMKNFITYLIFHYAKKALKDCWVFYFEIHSYKFAVLRDRKWDSLSNGKSFSILVPTDLVLRFWHPCQLKTFYQLKFSTEKFKWFYTSKFFTRMKINFWHKNTF